MKVKSEMIYGKICFDNFIVVKESNNFWGVYKKLFATLYDRNYLITSGTTKDSACVKAKMLQIGYDMALNDIDALQRERYWDS